MIVLGFYKYLHIDEPERFRNDLKRFCGNGNYRGIVLISHEGINASISGTREGISALKTFLTVDSVIGALFFKEEQTLDAHPFKRLNIKIKPEIIRFDCEVSLSNAGRHLSSTEFLDSYHEDGSLKENVVILDARNASEFDLGRFRGATHLNLKSFSEFSRKVDIDALKHKRVVMYCTGGVRCEKASAYLVEQGVKDVSQLHQGIIQFGKEYPRQAWEGKCLVFDHRMISPMCESQESARRCAVCDTECDFQRICRNASCSRVYVCCYECEEQMDKCCSVECRQAGKNQSFTGLPIRV